MKPKKILIWGGCGHGKTTLARTISKKTGIPHFDLDNVTFKEKGFEKVTDDVRDERLKKLLKHKTWVIEGAYVGEWMHQVIKDSDLIIMLNINKIIAQKRVLMRFIKRKLKIEKTKGGSIKDLPRILGYARNYCIDHLVKQKELIKQYKKKAIILKNKSQIKEFLTKIK